MSLLFWLTIGALTATCIAAIGTRALMEFAPHELKKLCESRGRPDRLAHILRYDDEATMAALTLRTLSLCVAAAAGTLWSIAGAAGISQISFPLTVPSNGFSTSGLAIRAIFGVLIVLATNLWIPWTFARLWATPILYFTWPFWRGVAIFFWPLIAAESFFNTILHRLAGKTNGAEDESLGEDIRTIVTAGQREGLLEEDAREMIAGVIELQDIDVSEIMTPRTEMFSISRSLPWREVIKRVTADGHSRVPVTDKNRDDVVGVLVTKDLLSLLGEAGPPDRPWTDLLREPYFVPETKPIDRLLQEFQQTRSHMAIVLDEYGGVAGLVTLEDVIEEIVGDIIDEFDVEHPEQDFRRIDENICEVLGKVHVDEINERLGTSLPEMDDYDTIAGLVFSRLGRIPVVGEALVVGNQRLTVLAASARRIERIKIEMDIQA